MPGSEHSRLHHVAFGARDVEGMARFYREIFGLCELERHMGQGGRLRSIWLDLGDGILMFEATDVATRPVATPAPGPFLLAFRVSLTERADLERLLLERGHSIEQRTAFTSYARDPEGNRVAFSHYPEAAASE